MDMLPAQVDKGGVFEDVTSDEELKWYGHHHNYCRRPRYSWD